MKICPGRRVNPKHFIEWEVKQGPDDPHPELNYLAAGTVRITHYPGYGGSSGCGGAGYAGGGGAGYQPPHTNVTHDWRKVVCVSYTDAATLDADIERERVS